MILYGLKEVDASFANKVLNTVFAINRLNTDFDGEDANILKDMRNNPVNNIRIFSDSWSEYIIIITVKDGDKFINYIAFVDADDGYRSRADAYKFETSEPICKNLVNYNIEVSIKQAFSDYVMKNEYRFVIRNKKDNMVMAECYTNWDDSYYPVGHIHVGVW